MPTVPNQAGSIPDWSEKLSRSSSPSSMSSAARSKSHGAPVFITSSKYIDVPRQWSRWWALFCTGSTIIMPILTSHTKTTLFRNEGSMKHDYTSVVGRAYREKKCAANHVCDLATQAGWLYLTSWGCKGAPHLRLKKLKRQFSSLFLCAKCWNALNACYDCGLPDLPRHWTFGSQLWLMRPCMLKAAEASIQCI